jgi:hypothetical protein
MRLLLALSPSFLGNNLDVADPAIVERYCAQIIEIAPIVRTRRWFDVVLAHETIAALMDAGLYPLPPTLRRALDRAGLQDVFTAEDIVRVLHRLVQEGLGYQQCFGIEQVLVDDSVSIAPLPDFVSSSPSLKRAEQDFFCTWATAATVGISKYASTVTLVLTMAPDVTIDARILAVEPADFLTVDPVKGHQLAISLPVVGLQHSFADVVDPMMIWNAAEGTDDIYLALVLRAYQIAKAENNTACWRDFAGHRIGSAFYESLTRNSAHGTKSHSSSTFDTCSRLLAGCPKNEVREFSVQARIDGSSAYRTHVSKRHEALRLMFWRLPDGRIELANVGPKHEEEIVSGDLTAYVSLAN